MSEHDWQVFRGIAGVAVSFFVSGYFTGKYVERFFTRVKEKL